MILPHEDNPPEFLNALNGRKVTWPYGSRKVVRVVEKDIGADRALGISLARVKPEYRRLTATIVVEFDAPTVGHVLLGGDHVHEPEKDRLYTMEFTKGGPFGGYWRIIEEVQS